MIVYTLESLMLDEAKEPVYSVEGLYADFQLLKDTATQLERESKMLNPPMFWAQAFELNTKVTVEHWTRWANGVWEKIPAP